MEHNPVLRKVAVRCPDCGDVEVKPDVFEHGLPVAGECPGCGDTLLFTQPRWAGEPESDLKPPAFRCRACKTLTDLRKDDRCPTCDRLLPRFKPEDAFK